MLDQLKTMFRSTQSNPSAVPAATHSPPALDAKLKGCQLAKGRTAAKVKALVSEIEIARANLVESERLLAERMLDELDSASSSEAAKQAADRVRFLEITLVAARLKDEAAEAELKLAQRQLANEAEAAAIARARASALELERVLAELTSIVAEFVSALTEIKDLSGGDTHIGHQVGKTCGVFRSYLNRSCSALIVEGTAYSDTLDKDKKPFSAWIDDLAGIVTARHRRAK